MYQDFQTVDYVNDNDDSEKVVQSQSQPMGLLIEV